MKTKNEWKVYIHTVPKEISGYDIDKKYVGMTKTSPEHRWEHGYGYRGNKHFFRAIEKYGWDNLKHEIVATNLSYKDACDLERMLIFLNDTMNPQKGYNKTLGGDGTLGRIPTEQERANKSKKYSGENNPYYGKKHSLETRQKMSKNHADFSGGNHPNARVVYRFSLNNEFIKKYDCVVEAAKDCNITDMSIFRAVEKGYVCAGCFWGFDKDVIKEKDSYSFKEKHSVRTTKKEIYQFTSDGCFIKKYNSVKEAGNENRLHSQNIGKVAIRKRGCSGGFQWRYVDDVINIENTYKIKEV